MTTDRRPDTTMDVALECGTSLAEWEHGTEEAPHKQQKHYVGPNPAISDGKASTSSAAIEELRDSIARDVVSGPSSDGGLQVFPSPFEHPPGSRGSSSSRFMEVPLVYCDQTASNRPLTSVEEYVSKVCLPLYGNTHTNTSVTGSQSTAFVAEARQIVAEGVNAKVTGKASQDVVLFAGSGATSAVELLIDCLGIKGIAASINQDTRPVVFVGPYEHHSNLLPWRESGCEIVMIPECSKTRDVDINVLEDMLQSPKYSAPGRLRMGTFAAASNVNGKVSDVDKIAATLHKEGALAFFDYATAAPYLPMDMNPSGCQDPALVAKDAIFISPHKMIGGINTPGILVVKKNLVSQTSAPGRSGGGTVFYVTSTHHRFLSNRIERYEGGTPNVVGIYRAGLAFLFKRKVRDRYLVARELKTRDADGDVEMANQSTMVSVPQSIEQYEYDTYNRVVSTLRQTAPNLIMLGADSICSSGNSSGPSHLPIFSFLIRAGRRFLHYNYVCALLNDLFGIQSRGGCQCSGPYSQTLLGLTKLVDGEEVPNEANKRTEYALIHFKERAELLRPGYTRLSLPFKGVSSAEVNYVLRALEWVAKHGWVMMCQYRCNHRTGEWRHFSRQGKPLGRTERRWLSHYDPFASTQDGVSRTASHEISPDHDAKVRMEEALANADVLLSVARADPMHTSKALSMGDENGILGTEDEMETLRWYIYPRECAKLVKEGEETIPNTFSDDILGAIRPLGHSVEVTRTCAAAQSTAADISTVEPTNPASNGIMTGSGDLLYFREGEHHSGEASLDDIEAGFNDGELSDNCEVFSPQEETWIAIEIFLQSRKKAKTTLREDEAPQQQLPQPPRTASRIEEEEKKSASPPPREDIPTPTCTEREKKKPSRDSSAWGRASAPVVCVAAPLKDGKDATEVEALLSSSNQTQIAAERKSIPKKYLGKKGRLKPPPKMMRYITQAMLQWDMIEEGDRLLLGLSGGKDSLSLLHCLLEFQRKLPIKFDIEVCTVDPMTPSFDPSPLIPYVESLGLQYHYVRDEIVARANTSGKDGKVVSSLCSFCARMKRGVLYTTARKNNCNKLVLAQHLVSFSRLNLT